MISRVSHRSRRIVARIPGTANTGAGTGPMRSFVSRSTGVHSSRGHSLHVPLIAAGTTMAIAGFHSTTVRADSKSGTAATASAPPAPTTLPADLPYKSADEFRSHATIKLYQYQTCPFCNKVRAYLDWARLSYEIVEVNPMNKKEIKFAAPHKAVPVVTVDGYTLTESSNIIDQIQSLLVRLDDSRTRSLSNNHQWREWVDKDLIYLTAPNLYTSLSASLDAMDYIMTASGLPPAQRYLSKYVGGPMMYAISEYKLKKKRNITDPRGQLYSACQNFVAGRPSGARYHGGSQPDLSDVTAFGVLRAFAGFPAGNDILDVTNTSAEFVDWYSGMRGEVGASVAKNPIGANVGADYKESAAAGH